MYVLYIVLFCFFKPTESFGISLFIVFVYVHKLICTSVCVYSRSILMCLCLSSCLPGDTEWLPGQELPLSPWDLVRKPLSQCITIRLKGTNLATRVCACFAAPAAKTRITSTTADNKWHLVDEKGFTNQFGGICSVGRDDLPAEPHHMKDHLSLLSCNLTKE